MERSKIHYSTLMVQRKSIPLGYTYLILIYKMIFGIDKHSNPINSITIITL